MLEKNIASMTLIDRLQLESENYYIDFLPKELKNKRFFQLEEYLLETYISSYANKIVMIAIKLISYYSAEIFLTDTNEELPSAWKDLRGESLSQIADIISYVIKNDFSSVQILFTETPFVMSINGGFSVAFYHASKENLDLIELLVGQEGLFLKKEVDYINFVYQDSCKL